MTGIFPLLSLHNKSDCTLRGSFNSWICCYYYQTVSHYLLDPDDCSVSRSRVAELSIYLYLSLILYLDRQWPFPASGFEWHTSYHCPIFATTPLYKKKNKLKKMSKPFEKRKTPGNVSQSGSRNVHKVVAALLELYIYTPQYIYIQYYCIFLWQSFYLSLSSAVLLKKKKKIK